MRPVSRVWLAAAIAVAAAALSVLGASALSISTAPISFPGVTIDGTDQTVTGSTTAWQADGTGETGGWNVTVASTDFDNGAGKTVAVSNFEIRLLDANIVVVSGDTNKPVSTQTAFGPLSGTAVKIASASAGTGDGVYDLTPDFRLTVPAETYTGSYTATVTVTVSAPLNASFVSVADTYAREFKPNDNHGTLTVMQVGSWLATKDERSFAQFDVSSIPAGSTVDSATLTLCATAVPGATRTYDAHRVTASWVETTLTWNNQPSVAASATDSVTTPAAPGCMAWTVTSDVQLWVDGTANNGWRVSDSVEGQGTKYITKFRTREDTAVPAEQPTLDVTYTAP